MIAPGMMPASPSPMYPAQPYVPRQPVVRATPPASTAATATSPPRPVIRAQAPEEPRPAKPPLLTLPSPEQLGVTVRPIDQSLDWTAIHARMKTLGVVSFHMDSLPDGRSRFTCWIPGDQPGLTRRIESTANIEAEAVQGGLDQAQRMRTSGIALNEGH